MKNPFIIGIVAGFAMFLLLSVGSINSGLITVKPSVPKDTKFVCTDSGNNTKSWVDFYSVRGYDVTVISIGTNSTYVLAKKY